MASINKCFMMGNLGADPEMRTTGGGQSVCNFRIACSEKFKDRDGQMQERTEWVSIVAWGRQAEIAAEYLRKGSPVHVEGRLQTREWEDKQGSKRYTTEVVAERVTLLGGKRDDDGQRAERGSGRREERPQAERYRKGEGGVYGDTKPKDDDGDLPF